MFDDDMIGNPDVQADFCETQIWDDNCAVVAETSIINQFHPDLNLDQETAAYISATNGWYQPGGGTSPDVIGNMMDSFGISSHTNTNATASDLAWELQQGHGIIVGVNSSELWETGPFAEIKHEICKAFGLDNQIWNPADHAVTVTGIDKSDPENPMVVINDSGVPDGAGVEYPLDKFIDAWENGGCYYVATDDPLPSMANVGSELESFWDHLSVPAVAGGVAGLGAMALTGYFTEDPELVLENGIEFGSFAYHLFSNEDFARLI